jgi:hypothetical protein
MNQIKRKLEYRQRIRDIRDARRPKPKEGVIFVKEGMWVKYEPSHLPGPHNIPPVNFAENVKVPEGGPSDPKYHFIPKKYWKETWKQYKKRSFHD